MLYEIREKICWSDVRNMDNSVASVLSVFFDFYPRQKIITILNIKCKKYGKLCKVKYVDVFLIPKTM